MTRRSALLLLASAAPAAPAGTARPVRFEAVLAGNGPGGGTALLAAVRSAAQRGLDTQVTSFAPNGRSLAATLVIDGRREADVRAAASAGVAAGMRLIGAGPVVPPSDAVVRRALRLLAPPPGQR